MRISDWSSDVCSSDLLQFASFRQSIRKARETEERARTAQAVLRSFEESGNNWLWETDENGLLTYVSPQFGRVLDRDCHELAGKRLADLFGRGADTTAKMSGLRILELPIAARLVFSEVIVPLKIDDAQRWLSKMGRAHV